MSVTLITGGAGFVGSNLAGRLLDDGEQVRILDDLSRPGVEENLRWLERRHGSQLQVEIGDLRDASMVRRAVLDVDHVFHLAAQVAVTTSLVEPMDDAAVNLQGTLNLLEAARGMSRPPSVLFTSTNKVYGALPDVPVEERGGRCAPVDPELAAHGISERRGLAFCTPYGCSKGAADQYVLDYAHSYGLATVVFRMSCIYGPHQFGTEDQGWVAHFLITALQGEPLTVYGTGHQVRDILFADDLVEAMLLARGSIDALAGRPFNIGGGPGSAVSLLQVVDEIERLTGEPLALAHEEWRTGDQRWYVSDTRAFQEATGWRPRIRPRQGITALYDWLSSAREVSRGVAAR
jgi:CDP-paratose 2-epimerase